MTLPEFKHRLRLALLAGLGCLVAGLLLVDGVNRLGETASCYNRSRNDLSVTLHHSGREILGECACLHLLFPVCS